MVDHQFRKSSFSRPEYNCVGVAFRKNRILVRNTNDAQAVTVQFTPEEWRAFVLGVKASEFDLPEGSA